MALLEMLDATKFDAERVRPVWPQYPRLSADGRPTVPHPPPCCWAGAPPTNPHRTKVRRAARRPARHTGKMLLRRGSAHQRDFL